MFVACCGCVSLCRSARSASSALSRSPTAPCAMCGLSRGARGVGPASCLSPRSRRAASAMRGVGGGCASPCGAAHQTACRRDRFLKRRKKGRVELRCSRAREIGCRVCRAIGLFGAVRLQNRMDGFAKLLSDRKQCKRQLL